MPQLKSYLKPQDISNWSFAQFTIEIQGRECGSSRFAELTWVFSLIHQGITGFCCILQVDRLYRLRKEVGAERLGGSPRIYAGVGALQRSGKFDSHHDAL